MSSTTLAAEITVPPEFLPDLFAAATRDVIGQASDLHLNLDEEAAISNLFAALQARAVLLDVRRHADACATLPVAVARQHVDSAITYLRADIHDAAEDKPSAFIVRMAKHLHELTKWADELTDRETVDG